MGPTVLTASMPFVRSIVRLDRSGDELRYLSSFDSGVVAIAVLITTTKLTWERFLSLRGLYAPGKQALRKQGLKIAFGSDDMAWYFELSIELISRSPLSLGIRLPNFALDRSSVPT